MVGIDCMVGSHKKEVDRMMELGVRYVVVASQINDGPFQVGDHIWLLEDGSIACLEAQGWIDPEHVPDALDGVEFAVDRKWLQAKKTQLQRQLSKLAENGVI